MTYFEQNPEPKLKCSRCDDKSCASQVLNIQELATLSLNCCESSFVRNETIVKEGSFTSHIIYLRSGLVKEFSKDERGQEHILQIVKSHAYLGLPSLFGNRINQYSYTALTDVKVCFIEMNVYKQMILENGRFSYEILATICRESLNNYSRLVGKQQKQLGGKIADTLLYFSKSIFNSEKFYLPLNRNEIAYLIGASRESVTKQLNEFVDDGLIQLEGRKMELLDMAKLEKISKFG